MSSRLTARSIQFHLYRMKVPGATFASPRARTVATIVPESVHERRFSAARLALAALMIVFLSQPMLGANLEATLPDNCRQCLVVTTPSWAASTRDTARLRTT